MYDLIERVFERLFEKKGDLALLRAFTDYAKGVGEFSDEEMNLNQMTAMHLQEVSPTIRVWEFQTTDSTLKKKPLDLVFIWKRIDTQADNELPAGRNALTRLAIRLLSVVANSAGCERSFSIFGNIHTKTRNKLGTETVHKTGILKMDIRRRHVEEGRVPTRKKRQFSTLDEPTSVTTPISVDPEADPIDFIQFGSHETDGSASQSVTRCSFTGTLALPRKVGWRGRSRYPKRRLTKRDRWAQILFDMTSTLLENNTLFIEPYVSPPFPHHLTPTNQSTAPPNLPPNLLHPPCP